MGREIRRVPADWEHPAYTADNAPRQDCVGDEIPLYDNDYESVSEEWLADLSLWTCGEHPSQPSKYARYFWEYDAPPGEDSYRKRKWTVEEATHFQVYETVSEGTPITPAFATKAELIDHLVLHGDEWDQSRGSGGWLREHAEQFVESGWAPSMMITRTATKLTIKEPRDGI